VSEERDLGSPKEENSTKPSSPAAVQREMFDSLAGRSGEEATGRGKGELTCGRLSKGKPILRIARELAEKK